MKTLRKQILTISIIGSALLVGAIVLDILKLISSSTGQSNSNQPEDITGASDAVLEEEQEAQPTEDPIGAEESKPEDIAHFAPITNANSENCTIRYGYLMLINPNFTVTTDFIDAHRGELVSVSSLLWYRGRQSL